MSSDQVSEFLEDLDYHQLTGSQETFDTFAAAINTTQQLEKLEKEMATPAQIWQAQTHLQENLKLEALQPRLAWKPLNIIKKTLENTTQ